MHALHKYTFQWEKLVRLCMKIKLIKVYVRDSTYQLSQSYLISKLLD